MASGGGGVLAKMAVAAAKQPQTAAAAATATLGCPSRALSTTSGKEREVKVDLKDAASLAAMKKGPGYRSSFSGMVATVFGASGCVGRGVTNRLGKMGSQMILPYRGDHYRYMRFKPCGDLGQVLFTPYHLKDEESIKRSMRHSNVVINLIGKDFPTRNFSLHDVHVEGPRLLARAARESGTVQRFVHISSLNAREEPDRLWSMRGSEYLRTKWLGEQAVLEEFPDATIFRPSDVYGLHDRFIWYYFRWGREGLNGAMPLWKKGEETVKAPLHFSDLTSGIMNSLSVPGAKGATFEAYGPEKYRMSDLMDWMAGITQRDPHDYNYHRTDLRLSPYTFAKAFLIQNLPLGTKYMGNMSVDLLERSSLSDDILGLPNLEDLGVKASTIFEKMPFELKPARKYAHYVPYDLYEEMQIKIPIPLENHEVREIRKLNQSSVMQTFGLA